MNQRYCQIIAASSVIIIIVGLAISRKIEGSPETYVVSGGVVQRWIEENKAESGLSDNQLRTLSQAAADQSRRHYKAASIRNRATTLVEGLAGFSAVGFIVIYFLSKTSRTSQTKRDNPH